MNKKFVHEEEGEEEEVDWKDSYSDLMTDLLAVFVLLLSFAMVNQSAAKRKAIDELQNMLDFTPKISILSGDEGVLPEQNSLIEQEEDINKLYEMIKEYIDEEGLSENLLVKKQGDDQILLRASAHVFLILEVQILMSAQIQFWTGFPLYL